MITKIILFYQLFFLFINSPKHVKAHGLMCTPRQRGAYVSDKCGHNIPLPSNPVVDYCAHCLNSQGPCGKESHMLGGSFMPYENIPIVKNYTQGQIVDFEAEIDTNHNGYFEFHLCDLDACAENDISEKCFEQNFCYLLERVPHEDCENPDMDTKYECGPIDENYPGRWYLPCRKTAHVGVHLVGGDKGTMRYKLPKNISCQRCVLQWFWQTANSCNPEGTKDYFINHNMPFGNKCPSDGGGMGAHNPKLSECTPSQGERFWSCADVMILQTTENKDSNNRIKSDIISDSEIDESRAKREEHETTSNKNVTTPGKNISATNEDQLSPLLEENGKETQSSSLDSKNANEESSPEFTPQSSPLEVSPTSITSYTCCDGCLCNNKFSSRYCNFFTKFICPVL